MLIKTIFAVLLSLLCESAHAQTGSVKTPPMLNAEVNSLWPDNCLGCITPFNSRQTLLDIIASYGSIGSGRPWCDVRAAGAVGDGVTDDSVAFNACKATLNSLGGGILYIPVSLNPYCVFSGVASGITGLVIWGESRTNSIISTCGHDVIGISMLAANQQLRNITVIAKGGRPSVDSFSATTSAIVLDQQCTECLLDHVTILGGLHAVEWHSSEAWVQYVTASLSYGSAIMYFSGTGGNVAAGTLYKIKPDQNEYPAGIINQGTAYPPPARANTTAYALKAVVSMTCQDTLSYYFQATVAGTSGGSTPTCKNYGQNMADGTVTWQFLFPNPFYHWQFDTLTNQVDVMHSDTGGGVSGVAMTNTLAGTAPTNIRITDSNGGTGWLSNFYGHDGNNVMLTNYFTAGCLSVGCANVNFNTNFTGIATMAGGVSELSPFGFQASAGNDYMVTGVYLGFNSTAGLNATNGVSRFVWSGNDCVGSGTCAQVNAGASDFYTIVNNVGGATLVSDSGTGTHKVVTTTDAILLGSTIASTSKITGAVQTAGGLGVGKAIYGGAEITTGVTTVGALPTCDAAHQGAHHFVTDQNTAVAYHGAVTPGGANKQSVTCDGSAWYQD